MPNKSSRPIKEDRDKTNKNNITSSCLLSLLPPHPQHPTQPPLSPHHQHYQPTIHKSITSSFPSNSSSEHKTTTCLHPTMPPINKLPLIKLPPYNNSRYLTIPWPSCGPLSLGIQWLLLILTSSGRIGLFTFISNTQPINNSFNSKQSQESQRVSTPYNPSTPPIHRRKKSTTPSKHKPSGLWPTNWI